jgi:hypothetical protein
MCRRIAAGVSAATVQKLRKLDGLHGSEAPSLEDFGGEPYLGSSEHNGSERPHGLHHLGGRLRVATRYKLQDTARDEGSVKDQIGVNSA